MSAVLQKHPDLEARPDDPLRVLTPQRYSKCFYPFGFPVRVTSNSRRVLDAAELAWSQSPRRFVTAELELRCFVADSESAASRTPAVFRSQEHLLTIVADSENFAAIDLSDGFSFGWVTSATAADTGYFRYMFLEAMAYIQLEIHHVVSVHAACVQLAGRGLLLAGYSGAGKSSLAYACARRGWTFLSDDGTGFVRGSAALEALGRPEEFRFRDTAGELFPELRHLAVSQRPAGKPSIEIATASLGDIRTARSGLVHGLVFLNRKAFDGGRPCLLPVSKEEAWRHLTTSLFVTQHPAYEQRRAELARLLNLPTFELRYREFEPAVETLHSLALRLAA